jgi:hypothetical protein
MSKVTISVKAEAVTALSNELQEISNQQLKVGTEQAALLAIQIKLSARASALQYSLGLLLK